MSSHYPDITMSQDEELWAALDQARRLKPDVDDQTLLQELLLRGVESLRKERHDDPEAKARFIALTTGEHSPFDDDLLANIERVAYGIDE